MIEVPEQGFDSLERLPAVQDVQNDGQTSKLLENLLQPFVNILGLSPKEMPVRNDETHHSENISVQPPNNANEDFEPPTHPTPKFFMFPVSDDSVDIHQLRRELDNKLQDRGIPLYSNNSIEFFAKVRKEYEKQGNSANIGIELSDHVEWEEEEHI
jgi:hypothetical protein